MFGDHLRERTSLRTSEQGLVVEQAVEQFHGLQATHPILELLAHRALGST
jgi:hypothetical protein